MRRRFFAGMKLGASVLIRRVRGAAGYFKTWLARCECGRTHRVNASQVGRGRCRTCSGAKRPRLCRTCGETDPEKFTMATHCEKCRIAASRNGRCPCGRAMRYRMVGTAAGAQARRDVGGRITTLWDLIPCACGSTAAPILPKRKAPKFRRRLVNGCIVMVET